MLCRGECICVEDTPLYTTYMYTPLYTTYTPLYITYTPLYTLCVYGVLGYLVLKGIFRKVSMFIIDTLYNVKCTFISRYDFHSYQLAILMRT